MTTPFDFLNAVAALERPDGVIAFPTDTVYGLGCLPWRTDAIAKIYHMKEREAEKPLILMSYKRDDLMPYIGELTPMQRKRFLEVTDAHWPGPLTLVLPKSEKVPAEMTHGIATVGLRVPDCPMLDVLFQMIPGGVLATTSANKSGQPEHLDAAQVFETFRGQLGFILINDRVGSGKPSTVAAIEPDGRIVLLRPGSLVLD